MAADVPKLRSEASELLELASSLLRSGGRWLYRADLSGKDLRATTLRDAYLRAGCLIAADLRGVDLSRADMLGTDMRGADVRGAKMRYSLFLTNSAVAGARGDKATTLPAHIDRPAHWE
jgi:uncharacterized protein YjbI with pentapeptide repeats